MHCWGSGEHTGSEHVRRPADCTTALQNTACQHDNTKNTFIILWLSFTAFICHFQSIYCPLFLFIIILSDLNSYDSHPFFYFCPPPPPFFSLDLTCFITSIPIICNDSYWLSGFLHFLLTHIRIDFLLSGLTVECLFCNIVLLSFLLLIHCQSTFQTLFLKLLYLYLRPKKCNFGLTHIPL